MSDDRKPLKVEITWDKGVGQYLIEVVDEKGAVLLRGWRTTVAEAKAWGVKAAGPRFVPTHSWGR